MTLTRLVVAALVARSVPSGGGSVLTHLCRHHLCPLHDASLVLLDHDPQLSLGLVCQWKSSLIETAYRHCLLTSPTRQTHMCICEHGISTCASRCTKRSNARLLQSSSTSVGAAILYVDCSSYFVVHWTIVTIRCSNCASTVAEARIR